MAAVAAVAGARGEMGEGWITSSTPSMSKIYGGMVYTVQGNVELKGNPEESALVVEASSGNDGKRIVIDIPQGCTLKVTGGNGDGRGSAGAGIELPGDMTLYITGKGSLVATGGNAANGGNGSDGSSASCLHQRTTGLVCTWWLRTGWMAN